MNNRTETINDLTKKFIMSFGLEVGELNDFTAEMVVLEGVVAGLVVSAAVRFNRQPDDLIQILAEGIQQRADRLIYGEKQ